MDDLPCRPQYVPSADRSYSLIAQSCCLVPLRMGNMQDMRCQVVAIKLALPMGVPTAAGRAATELPGLIIFQTCERGPGRRGDMLSLALLQRGIRCTIYQNEGVDQACDKVEEWLVLDCTPVGTERCRRHVFTSLVHLP